MKPVKKIITTDFSIDTAEDKLEIKYSQVIRDKLKKTNGFDWGGYRFFCVLDEEDKFHTFDDVIRENNSEDTGWVNFLPKEYIAIADDGGRGCLVLNKNKDGKVYYFNNELNKIEIFSESESDFLNKMIEGENNL